MDDAASRVVFLFGATFPVVVFVLVAYVALANIAFRIFRVIGKRVNRTVRRLSRDAYVFGNSLLGAVLVVSAEVTCAEETLCDFELTTNSQIFAAGASAVAVLVLLWADRVSVPLWGFVGSESYSVSMESRLCRAVALGVVWIAVSERDAASVHVLSVLLLRRVFAFTPRVEQGVVVLFKVRTLARAFLVLRHCEGSKRRMAVASGLGVSIL